MLPKSGVGPVILVSVVLGIGWNLIAVWLMGGRFKEAFAPAWMLAGAIAGVVAGIYTIGSRRRRDGQESLFHGIANYYLGIFVYWLSFVVIERVILCYERGGWTNFDLHDHLSLILVFLYGTFWYGIFLIPLNFLTRQLLWKVYSWSAARPQG